MQGETLVGEAPINLSIINDDTKRKSEQILNQKVKVPRIEDENDSNSRRKPGRKRLEVTESKSKKEKNRVAQRAWRERKEKYVLELEAKIAELEEAKNKTENEKQQLQLAIEKLKYENSYLKNATSFIFTPDKKTQDLIDSKNLNIHKAQISNNTYNTSFTNTNVIQNNSITIPNHNQDNINTTHSLLHTINNNPKLANSLLEQNIINNGDNNSPSSQTKDIFTKNNIINNNELLNQEPTPPMQTNDYNIEVSDTTMIEELLKSINNGNNNVDLSSLGKPSLDPSMILQNPAIVNNNLVNDPLVISTLKENLKSNSSFSTNQNINNILLVNNLNNNNTNENFTTQPSSNITDNSLLMSHSLPFMNDINNNPDEISKLINDATSTTTSSALATVTTKDINPDLSSLLLNNTNTNLNSFYPLLPVDNQATNFKPMATSAEAFNNNLTMQLSTQQPLNLPLLSSEVPTNAFQNFSGIQGFADLTKDQNVQDLFALTPDLKLIDDINSTNPMFSYYRDNTSTGIQNSNFGNANDNTNFYDDDAQNTNQLISDDLFNNMIQLLHQQNEENSNEDDELDSLDNINNMNKMKNGGDNMTALGINNYLNTPITPELSLKESSSSPEMDKSSPLTSSNEYMAENNSSNESMNEATTNEEKLNKIKSEKNGEEASKDQTSTTNNTNSKKSISTLQFPEKQQPTKLNIPYNVFPKVSPETVDNFINDAKLTDEELDSLCLELKKKATCKDKLKYIQKSMTIEGWSMEKWEKGRIKKKIYS